MFHPFLLAALCLLLAGAAHYGAYRVWAAWFVPREVRINDRDFTANGSQDSLRKAYHAYRTKVRLAYFVPLALLPNLLLLPLGWLPALLGFVGLGWLLAAYFGRRFTPLLNLARVASGRTDLNEWHASSDSASWPDAAAWKIVRQKAYNLTSTDTQLYADSLLQELLTRTWLYGRLGYGVLVVAGVVVALL